MEISKKEIELAQQAVADANTAAMSELVCLELALIGGGCGNELFG